VRSHSLLSPFPAAAQEARQVQAIADYFQRPIPEVPFSDEEAFLAVLRAAGLADQEGGQP
jgi:hypothetical protein